MAAPTFRKKKQWQSRVFFDFVFDVYTHVDNREIARASDWKQKGRILYEEKHENSKQHVRQWEMLAASKERPARWKWGAVKNKSEHEHRRQNIG